MGLVAISSSIEDYLKTIYALKQDGLVATTGLIAEKLSVAPASVTGMVKKLESAIPPLAERHPGEGVDLTGEGRLAALRTLRRHRLIEQFLMEVLHYPWDEVHEEADRLEHVISPLFEERLAMLLGQPEFDPHGDPIPDADLNLPPTPFTELAKLEEGDQAIVRRIRRDEPEMLRYLAQVGLLPGARVVILQQAGLSQSIRLQVGLVETSIGEDLGRSIWVEKEDRR